MDVRCTTCGEPWDVYHLWHEAIFDTGLSLEAGRFWRSLPSSRKLSPRYRELFQAVGWEFGRGVINVIHCPCCPKEARPNAERLQTKAELEALLGDDEDGLATTFEDHDL